MSTCLIAAMQITLESTIMELIALPRSYQSSSDNDILGAQGFVQVCFPPRVGPGGMSFDMAAIDLPAPGRAERGAQIATWVRWRCHAVNRDEVSCSI